MFPVLFNGSYFRFSSRSLHNHLVFPFWNSGTNNINLIIWQQWKKTHIAAQQSRAGQWSITANRWPLTANVYHVMIIVTSGIYFYQYHFYFLEFLLNYLELVFLQFKHIYKPQRTSLFPFHLFIFYLLFHNHSVY